MRLAHTGSRQGWVDGYAGGSGVDGVVYACAQVYGPV